MGNVPWGLRWPLSGAADPVQVSSIPPVPKVILVRPGRTQPCPISEPCWSPTSAAIGGAPSSAEASPMAPLESTIVGRHERGMRRVSSTWSDHCRSRWSSSPVTAALLGSVTWSRPSDSVHASHVSTVPKHRSRERSGSCAFSRAASLVADWLGASRMPWSPASVRQSNTVRRSCQPMAGATGTPVARSHSTVEARWLVMPTASTGPASASVARAAASTASAISVASNSTSPGNGVLGGSRCWWTWETVASGWTMAARRLLVPTSMTRTLIGSRSRPFGPAAPTTVHGGRDRKECGQIGHERPNGAGPCRSLHRSPLSAARAIRSLRSLIAGTGRRGRGRSCRAGRPPCRPSARGGGSRPPGSSSPRRPDSAAARRRRPGR